MQSPLAKRVRARLWGTALLLTLASFAGQVVRLSTGHDRVYGLIPLLDIGREANLPTWFSSVLLLAGAVLLAITGWAQRERRQQWVRSWFALAGVFTLMSIDEIAQIHERLGRFARPGSTGEISYLWVIPAGVFVLVLAVAFLRFARSLPTPTRRGFTLAAAVFLGGAIGGELVGEWVSRVYGSEGYAYVVTAHIEELLEMTGSILFIEALVAHLSRLGVRLEPGALRAESLP